MAVPSAPGAGGTMRTLDARPTLPRQAAREVYDGFARKGHLGGRDSGGGYGGPAVTALLQLAAFTDATTVFDFGCGQAKLAELALAEHEQLVWHGVDQSPLMVEAACARMRLFGGRFTCELLEGGDPASARVPCAPRELDRFVSTYCLDLLSEDDMHAVLDLAERSLHPQRGLLLLAGITWGWRDSVRTCFMTALWELLYRFSPRTVGGCRPQHLEPYLHSRGWQVVRAVRTMPAGFPWMVSEVIAARPPNRG